MNINGHDITPEEILGKLAQLENVWSDMMYAVIMDDPLYLDELPGSNHKKRRLIDELVERFIETEEYEKCAELVKLKKW